MTPEASKQIKDDCERDEAKAQTYQDARLQIARDIIGDWLNDDWEHSHGPWVSGKADLKQLCNLIAQNLPRQSK